MVSEQPSRKVVKALGDAGFTVARTNGPHTIWTHPTGVMVPVPDGHRTVSPGVYRKVLAALAEAERRKGQTP